MKKTSLRRTSVLTLVVMLVSLMSVFVFPVQAKAPVNEDFLADASYSYTTLAKNAYIVNANWTDDQLVSGASLQYVFRNAKKTVTYDPAKHFNSFAKAYEAFKASVSNISTLVNSSPVFILNGTIKEDITVSANAVLLGNNAGISPNAELDTKAAENPMTDWAEGQRVEETVIQGTITHTNVADYESVASANTKYKLLVDGFTLETSAANLFAAKDSVATYNKTQVYSFYNCIVNATNGMYLFSSVSSASNTNCYALKNIRITNNTFVSMFDGSTQRMHIDGLCFADNTAKIIDTTFTSKYIDFDMRNSYVYDNNAGYIINTYYSQTSSHISSMNIHNSIFRDSCSGYYGFATFRSNAGDSGSNYLVNLTGNTFISTTDTKYTLINGASDIFRGAITLNLNHNRVIGYESMFPNSTAYHIEADFNYNYFQPVYDANDTVYTDNVNGADWVRSHYSEALVESWLEDTSKTRETVPYVDPFDWKMIKYYSDYNLTIREDMLNITGATFYDDVENLAIDNANNKIALVTKVNLTNLSATSGFIFSTTPDKVEYFYTKREFNWSSFGYVTTEYPITAINASSNSFEVCYVRATKNGVSRTFEITLNSDPTFTVPAFSSDFICPTGELSSSAYLYMPGISGTTYTLSINGSKYSFSVGTNAFSNINDIFSKADNAKIIVGPGSHSAITVTENCELYGVNYATPASNGTGAAERYYGASWNTTNRSTLAGITVSGGSTVKISGVTVTGAVTSTAATTKIYNSDLKGGITANGVTNLTVEGSRIASSSAAINGTLPATTTFKSNYVTSATKLFASGWSATSGCKLTIDGSRFDNVTAGYLPSPTGSATHSGSTLSVTNSAFMTNSAVSGVVTANPSLCTMSFVGNAFVNTASSQSKAFSTTTAFTLKENRFVGFEPGVVTDYNYYAPYTPNFMEAANGQALGNVYYIDYKLGALVSDVRLQEINLGYSGAQYVGFSNASRTIRIRLASGNAGEVSFRFTGNLPYTIYSDANCTSEVSLYQATYSAGAKYTFYLLANYQTKDRAFKIVVDCLDPAGEFTETFENETIRNDAYILLPSSTSVANGERITANWLGTNYHFTKGINAFDNAADIYNTAKEKGIETPQILVPSWSGNLNLDYAGYYYAPNYNVSPYVIAGTATDGSDWAYNDAYTANKVTVGNIVIGAGATGKIGVYGFEMTGRYNDQSRAVDCPLDVHLENILVNSTAAVHGLLRCDNDCVRIDEQNANLDNHDELYVKNMYIQTTKVYRFMTEFYPEKVTFDGLFFDFESGYADSNVNYIKLTGKDPVLTFKNSNLRNFEPTSNRFYFEGSHTTVAEYCSSTINWENNILYNFRTSGTSLFAMYFEWLTHFNFTGNKVLHSVETPVDIFSSARNAASVNYFGTAIRITDNVLLGINTTASMGTNIFNTADSVISGNYTSPDSETSPQTLSVSNSSSQSVSSTNYAVSTLLDALNTDFTIVKITGKGSAVIDGYNITYTSISSRVQLFTHTFGSDAITAKFYSDAACTTTVATTTNGTCYIRGEYTYPDGSVIYFNEHIYTATSKNVSVSGKVFTQDWVEDEYITKEAMLVSNAVSTSTNATYHKATWNGVSYIFLKGINAFATVEEAYAYAAANGITNPQYLILDIGGSKGTTVIGEYNFTCPGSYFTLNYNKMPYKKGTKADGSDWKTNVGTSTTSFKLANTIQFNWFSAKNATIPGDYNFYGFTIRGSFEDIRNSDIEINYHLENTYFNMTYTSTSLQSALYSGGSRFTENANTYTDSLTIKNMYFVSSVEKPFFLANMNLWPNLEIDGLFADFGSASTTFNTTDLYQRAKNSSLVIRNSNIRNKIRENSMTYHGLAALYIGKIDKKLIIEDNIFYNYSSYNSSRFMYANMQYLTEFSFKGNHVTMPDMSDVELIKSTSNVSYTPTDCKVLIQENYLNGIGSVANLNSRSVTADSYIGRNYTSPRYSLGAVGSRFYSTGLDGAEYYLDANMTILSNQITPMTVGGQPFDTDGMTASVEVTPDTTVVDVTALIDEGYNSITGYLDSGFTIPVSLDNFAVANAGSRVYLKVTSHDGSVSQTRILDILRADGFAVENQVIGSSYNKTEDETVFNWLTWRGKVTATGELTFSTNEKMSHRVGIIYFSSASNIDTMKQQLETALTASTLDGADAAVDEVNAAMTELGAASGIKAYVMNKKKTLVWDSVTQSYGYRYNFSVEEGYLRGAIMYVMYEDADGVHVSFSEHKVLRSES